MSESTEESVEVLKQFKDVSKMTAEELFKELMFQMLEKDQDTLTCQLEADNSDGSVTIIELDCRIVKLVNK